MRFVTTADAALFILTIGATAANSQPATETAAAAAAMEQAVVAAIARAEPSVVAISRTSPAESNTTEQRAVDTLEDLRQTAPIGAKPAVVASGVIIDRTGLVLTQYLAIRDGADHTINTIDGTAYSAKIRAADPRTGLAILQISSPASPLQRAGPAPSIPSSFPPIAIADASTVRKGQFVLAIGNPFAIATDGQPTTSLGIITNIARKAPPGTNFNDAPGSAKDFRTTIHHLGTLLQTDAKLGWSTGGGALVNLRGELVGLTTTASVIAGHEQPAGYAIPMSAAIRRAIDALKQGREVEYGMLGIGFGPEPVASDTASRPRLGVAVVYPTGPAARAGIQPSDVITHVDHQPVADIDAVQLGISALPPGSTVDVAYERDGRSATTRVTLAKLAIAGKIIATVRSDAWRGMRVDYSTTLDAPALKQAIDSGALDKQGCVLVADVEPGSIAWREGVRPGMFVSHVAGKRVSTPEEFRTAVKQLAETLDLRFTTLLSPEPASENPD